MSEISHRRKLPFSNEVLIVNGLLRRAKLRRELEHRGFISVSELVDFLQVSPSTVRRDLAKLAREGHLLRGHGGAIAYPHFSPQTGHESRSAKAPRQKRAIGALAAEMVRDNELIFLDVGTTVLQVALHLPPIKGLTVVTPGLSTAEALGARDDIRVIVTGGWVLPGSHGLVGPNVTEMLSEFHIDKAFIGGTAVDPEWGLLNFNIEEVPTRRLVVSKARQVIAVVDSSKFGLTSKVQAVPFADIDTLVTDSGLSEEVKHGLETLGVEVLTAPLSDEKQRDLNGTRRT